jgi:type I restriction enzyme S subunit
VEWLGEVPEHWEVVQFKQFVDIQNGSDHKHVEQDDGYPVIGSGGIFTYASDFLYDGESVLLGRKGTIDKPLHITGRFWTVDTMYWTKIAPDASGRFTYYSALTIPFNYYSTNTALPSMTKGALNSHFLARPPLPEQTQIATFLDRETAKIDALIAEQQRLIALLAEKRQATISHAVTKGMNPDAPMKDSGVEWLGEVPEGWEVKRVKDVIDKIESGTSVNAIDDPADDGSLGVLKTSCVYTGQFNPLENKTVVAEEIERVSCQLKAGTLVVSRMNTPDLVGAAGLVKVAPKNIYLPDRLWQVSFSSAIPAYVHYWTQTDLYRGLIRSVCAGTSSSMQNLGQDQFKSFVFPTPPMKEQGSIVAFLDSETAKLDTLTAEAQRAIALLQERRTALISAAVTGKIDVR